MSSYKRSLFKGNIRVFFRVGMAHLSAREPQKEVSFPTIMAFRAFFGATPGVVEEDKGDECGIGQWNKKNPLGCQRVKAQHIYLGFI